MLTEWKERWHKYWNRVDVWETCHTFSGTFWIVAFTFAFFALCGFWAGTMLWPSGFSFLLLIAAIILVCLAVYGTKP